MVHKNILVMIFSGTFKGRFISKTFNNFNRLNHHWPKILPNLNSHYFTKVRIQIGENFRSVVVQTVEIVKGFQDKYTFTAHLILEDSLFGSVDISSSLPLSAMLKYL